MSLKRFKAPKSSRISSRREIRRLFEQGRRAGDDRLLMIGLANPENAGKVRGAVIVSRKHGKAHERNAVKRRCREAFRLVRPSLPGGYDFLLLPRSHYRPQVGELKQSIPVLADQLQRKSASKG
jgi:ribonuclease P protein component